MSEYSKDNLDQDFLRIEESFKARLNALRTGRARPDQFNNISVEAYGATSNLKSLANIVIEGALSVVITPYDKSVVDEIVKAITDSDLGLNPVNEGDKIRISIPSLTEDTRKATVKDMKQMLEQARIQVRQARQKNLDKIDRAEDTSEDQQGMMKKEVQKVVDAMNGKLQQMADTKEKEIMSI